MATPAGGASDNTGKSLAQLLAELRGAVEATGAADTELRNRIAHSLSTIANRLLAWGTRLSSIAQPPDPGTVKDANEGIDRLEEELRSLDVWLNTRSEFHWTTLQSSIQYARKNYLTSKRKASLSTYQEWLITPNRKLTRSIKKGYNNDRIDAAEGIIAFAMALKNAADALISASGTP